MEIRIKNRIKNRIKILATKRSSDKKSDKNSKNSFVTKCSSDKKSDGFHRMDFSRQVLSQTGVSIFGVIQNLLIMFRRRQQGGEAVLISERNNVHSAVKALFGS